MNPQEDFPSSSTDTPRLPINSQPTSNQEPNSSLGTDHGSPQSSKLSASTMSTTQSEIVLFGDLTCDYVSGLRSMTAVKENPLLTSFFERVTFGLRQEIGELPASERSRFARFITFHELVAHVQKAPTVHPALEKALVCVYQLACFINHYTAPGKRYPTAQDTTLVGLCTGLLSASAVSCCQSVGDLVPLAAHTVLVAFRAGLCVSEVRDRVEPQKDGPPAPWSVLVPGLDGEKAALLLKQFSEDKCLPNTSAVYISTFANAGLTLSGPPSALKDLMSSSYLPSNRSLAIPIHAPYHASHLYQAADIERILEPTRAGNFNGYARQFTVMSTVRGEAVGAGAYGDLMAVTLRAILCEPLRLDQLTSTLAQGLADSEKDCTVLPIATVFGQSFVAMLRRQSQREVSIDPCMNFSAAVREDGTSSAGNLGRSKLAIIGYSGRYPSAKSNDEFWQLLQEGRDVASFTPSNRWDHRTHVDPTLKRKNTMGTPFGCWLEEPGLFDANFFMISPREAPQIDPAQRLALMTAYEAMENAGFVPDSTPSTQSERVGVFYGTTSNDWGEINSSQNVDTYYIPGSCRAFIPGRQNFFYKFSGPSYSVDTACSSSLAALHLACNSLLKGDIDTAFCGGTNVLTNPDISAGLDRGHFLSRTGNCKTFDDDADGYCRGEGVCTLIIKRLEDAKADNDPICGLILGAYTNHSAEAESITRPHVGAQKAIFEKVLTSAEVDPTSINYIEMHGTGTQAGDAREMKSVLSVFSDGQMRSEAEKLYLGSVKANIGHGESVSGVLALIKSLMMMERNMIPPHVGIKNKINSGFPTDLAERNVHIAMQPTEWQRPEGGSRRVMINNFSAAGGNSSVLIEDAPRALAAKGRQQPNEGHRSMHVVAVGAKSSTALTANVKSLLAYMDKEKPSLANLSYTTTARRMHHSYRVMVAGGDLAEVSSQLRNKLSSPKMSQKTRAMQRVAFAFTGQGSQWLGMMKELLKFESFRRDMERYDALCQTLGFDSIAPLMCDTDTEGGVAALPPLITQVGTTCMQMAVARWWRLLGVEPTMVVGHSLGEYAALNAAGALSEADTIFLCGTRARLIQEIISFHTHSMLAVGASVQEAREICAGLDCEIACINAPSETVLSGPNDQIDEALERVAQTSLRKTKLQVPFAFHSSQMEPVLEAFRAATRAVKFEHPTIPIVSPLLGEVLTTKDQLGPDYLARHCRETVNFVAGIQAAQAAGLQSSTIWVEIGAHPVVSGLLRSNLGAQTVTLATLQRNKDAWRTLTSTLTTLYEAGVDVKWAEYHRSFQKSLSVLRLPSYSWDLKEYWMQYTGDWTLYKGSVDFRQGAPALSTTCVHRLVEEKREGDTVLVVGECDVLREDVDHFVRGHRVNGVPLVTPSVYAEMALVLGEYLRRQQPALAGSLADLRHMDVQRPFATKSQGKGPQLLRCCVALDTRTHRGDVEFWSVTPEGRKLVRHAVAALAFPDRAEAHAAATARAGPVLARMRDLAARLHGDDRVQKLTGKTGYQLVSSLAGYDAEYMGVSAVLLDSANLEAVATVSFAGQPRKPAGTFHVNPYLIDNFGQPALFIMNANDRADLSKEVFVNHGWTSLHFYKPVSLDATYRSHVRMQGPDADGLYHGDMVVFDSADEVVALYGGIKAQGVPRRLMDYIVHMRDDTKTGKPVGGTLGAAADAAAAADAPAAAAAGGAPATTRPVDEDAAARDTWPAALKIISEESGVPVAELKAEAAFADLGVDSLLALLCASRFREELGLHYESAIFLDNETLGDLEVFWKGDGDAAGAPSRSLSGNDAVLNSMFAADADAHLDDSSDSSPDTQSLAGSEGSRRRGSTSSVTSAETSLPPTPPAKEEAEAGDGPLAAVAAAARPVQATSLLLQGNPASPATTKTLFLLPDGSGSCSSYAGLPRLDPSLAVVGLNCPFMKTPEDYRGGIEAVGAAYLREIRRRQPHGPYALGGWSVGGIFAFHAAQALAAQGEVVAELVLLDCPVPAGLDRLPRRYYDYCAGVGLLGTPAGLPGSSSSSSNSSGSRHGGASSPAAARRAPPPWLVGHFEACVASLHDHHAAPFAPAARAPRTQVVWACDAVDRHRAVKFERRPDDPAGLRFLTEARADFGPCGWEALLPRDALALTRVPDCDHFSMMRGDGAKTLAALVAQFLMEEPSSSSS